MQLLCIHVFYIFPNFQQSQWGEEELEEGQDEDSESSEEEVYV